MRVRRGFTLIDLFVVMAVVFVLIGLLLPAVQAAREGARRTQCKSNLSQIGLALQNYEMAFEVLPPGTVNPGGPIVNKPASNAYHVSWAVQLLPHLELGNTYRRFDFRYGVYDQRNMPPQKFPISVLVCPSTGGGPNYAGCHAGRETPIDADNDGCLYLNSAVRFDDVVDGCAHTIVIGEVLSSGAGGWASGTRATLRNTGWTPNTGNNFGVGGSGVTYVEDFSGQGGLEKLDASVSEAEVVDPATATPQDLAVGGFGSVHNTGIQVGFCDGSVRFVNDQIDRVVFSGLGGRDDGVMPTAF